MILKDNEYNVIGTRPIRHDGLEKVTGRAVYGADVQLPNMSHGAILRSPHAHAKIISIDTSEAEKMSGVFAVITGNDFETGIDKDIEIGEGIANFKYDSMNIMARDKVGYVGHAVAAVNAKDKNTALEAIKKIRVKYDVLEPVLTVDRAMEKDSPVIQEDFTGVDINGERSSKNVADYFQFNFGNVEKGFESSDIVIEKEFTMPMVHQGYIEPHVAVAQWGEDGRLNLWTSTQGAFPVRTQTSGILGMPESRVRVMPAEIGGGFGGKTRVYLTPLAAVLSKKSNRPVKMVMDRISVFDASGPAPGGKVKIKLGVNSNKKLTSAYADIRLEGGAFGGSAVGASAKCVFSCYDIENTKIDGYDLVVNKPKSAAYRAPGSPQVSYAIEVTIDEICKSQGWDSLEFRILNASTEGTRRGDGPKFPKIGNLDALEAVQKSDHWNSTKPKSKSGKLIGRFSFGILTILLSLSYAIGIGHPQYLCLETPQSFNLKLIFFIPNFFFSNISMVLIIESFGTFKPFRKSELKIIPDPVYAFSLIVKFSSSSSGFTTGIIFKLYFFAKSKSLWSCAGQPNIAPRP